MHRIGTYVIIGILAVATFSGISSSRLFAGPCAHPIPYRVGDIDSRFGVSTSTVKELLADAEEVWETPVDRELFVYDSEADFVIDFEFDHRQQTTDTVRSYEDTLTDLEASHSEIINAYQSASNEYESRLNSYETQLNAYEADLEAYNQTVRDWNQQGGAPENERDDLIAEQERLRDELNRLETQQDDLEILRRQVNDLADRGNTVAAEYNETASTFTERFGSPREFSQAIFTGDKMTVYQFEDQSDLRLALTHELGHALGVGHVSSSDSVMYYLMEDQPLENISLTAEDQEALYNVCEIDA